MSLRPHPRIPVAMRGGPLAALAAVVLAAAVSGGCSTVGVKSSERAVTEGVVAPTRPGKGGYYLDDGPGDNPPADLASVPDAVPRIEPLHRGAMRPYTVMGVTYTPMARLGPYKARGVATWYGRRYHGKRTSTGEIYDMYAMTAAHTTLPLPSYARVTSVANGRSVIVRVNDRGPFRSDRLIDLSYAAAYRLGLLEQGSGLVDVEAILPSESSPVAYVEAGEDGDTSPLASLPATSGVFLQFGAFSERGYAYDLVRKLRADMPDIGGPLSVFTIGGLYRVQAGPFADRVAARQEADRIDRRLGARPFILER